jgi:hypothetical protein
MKKAEINISDVKSLHSKGLSTTKISLALNTSVGRIRAVLCEINVDENKYIKPLKSYSYLINDVKSMYEKGFSKKTIARKLDTYFEVVSNIINVNNISNKCKEGYKRCSNCKNELHLILFGVFKQSNDGLRHTCKQCRKKEPSRKDYLKEWTSKNREKKNISDKEYRKKNIEKINIYKSSDHYKKIKARSDTKLYLKNKNIPEKLMAMRLRSMVSECVKNKNFRTFKLLGYNSTDLTKHLESKFTEEMSWSNYGRNGWHIDHIRPLVTFDLTEKNQIKEAFSIENLQPLMEHDNCSKGSLYNGIRHYKRQINLKQSI